MLNTRKLVSGGVITNYHCSSRCRHCVYASSPHWASDYMSRPRADEVFGFLKSAGCSRVHIGGGEPLLQPEKLLPILESAREQGVGIDYIETNSSWYQGPGQAATVLEGLQKLGVDTLLVSIDPFHNEFIPFRKVKGLLEVCRNTGMEVFPWRMEFWDDLERMGDSIPHSLEEFTTVFGPDYPSQLIQRYRLNMRGRALQTFKALLPPLPLETVLNQSGPCQELDGIHHFHIDLHGYFIPEQCPGLSIHLDDLATWQTSGRYPFFLALNSQGIRGLLDRVTREYGFSPQKTYVSKCDLCYDLRRFLVLDRGLDSPDLQPQDHYRYM